MPRRRSRPLARRPDTFWVQLLSAGTEISCNIQTRTPEESDELVLEKLPAPPRRADRAGVLYYLVDVPLRSLGYRAEARLRLTVRPATLVATAAELARHPEVLFASAVTGPANLMATIACRDSAGLYRFLTERVGALDGVQTVESAPIIRTVKGAGALLPTQPSTTASAARRAASGGSGRTRRSASAGDTHS